MPEQTPPLSDAARNYLQSIVDQEQLRRIHARSNNKVDMETPAYPESLDAELPWMQKAQASIRMLDITTFHSLQEANTPNSLFNRLLERVRIAAGEALKHSAALQQSGHVDDATLVHDASRALIPITERAMKPLQEEFRLNMALRRRKGTVLKEATQLPPPPRQIGPGTVPENREGKNEGPGVNTLPGKLGAD